MANIASQNDYQQTNDDDRPLSRSEYRKQQQREQEAFAQRDRERLRAEKRYAKQHQDPQVDQSEQAMLTQNKVDRLKRRLNWAIFGLTFAIIATFLVLFFVEF